MSNTTAIVTINVDCAGGVKKSLNISRRLLQRRTYLRRVAEYAAGRSITDAELDKIAKSAKPFN